MKLRNLAGAMLALAAFGFAALPASAADIYDVHACDQYGTSVQEGVVPLYTPDDPMNVGTKAYFKVRFRPPLEDYGYSTNKWSFVYMGGGSEQVVLQPQIGIFVSGEQTWATYIGAIYTEAGENADGGKYYFTDVVFEYLTKPGDFALPIVLAMDDGGKPVPASDSSTVMTTKGYYLNPLLTSWRLCIDRADGGRSEAQWKITSVDPALKNRPLIDPSLKKAGYCVRTIDFAEPWETAKGESDPLWRSVHENTTVTKNYAAQLEAQSAGAESKVLFVWSLNEAAVRVGGKEVTSESEWNAFKVKKNQKEPVWRRISMPWPGDPNVTTNYCVGMVLVPAGAKTGDMTLTGVKEGGKADLVLCAYDRFRVSDADNNVIGDYLTVPVKCIEPLPPSVVVETSTAVAIAGSNYKKAAARLTVRLTQAVSAPITVRLTPLLADGTDISTSEAAGEYVRFSKTKEEVSTLPDATNGVEVTIGPDVGSTASVYVFCLRGDEHTTGVGRELQFQTSGVSGPIGEIDPGEGWTKGGFNVEAQNPEILEPEEGDDSLTAVAGTPRTLNIKIADAYADMTSTNTGYQIWIRTDSDTVTTFTQLDGTFGLGKGDYLYKLVDGRVTDELPSVIYSNTEAPNKSIIYVKSPVSRNESEMRNFTVTVSAPAGFTVNAVDDAGEIIKNPQYLEGDDVSISVVFDKQNTSGASLYAFLSPVTEKDLKAVDCAFIAAPGGFGLEIPQYGKGCEGFFKMIDGCTGAANSQFRYKIELRTAAVYEDGTPVESYMCKNTLALKSTNVIPKVDTVSMGLNETDETGHFPGVVVAKGTRQGFIANVTEPGLADLLAEGAQAFQAKWVFSTAGVGNKGPEEADSKGIVYGDPATNEVHFTFTKAGTWTVKLQLKDKDMANFGDGVEKATFTFYVDVVDQPTITVTGLDSGMGERTTFLEGESLDFGGESYVRVNLSMNPCDFDMTVGLTVMPGDASSANPGRFVLQTGDGVREVAPNSYAITFESGVTEVVIPVKDLDGTAVSKSQGFKFAMTNMTHRIVPDSGERYADEYFRGVTGTLKVSNEAPIVDELDLSPLPGSTNTVAIGMDQTISWNFTDVLGDFEGGISVKVDGGATSTNATVHTAAEAAGSFTTHFDTSGLHTLRLTVTDKDKGSVSFVWYYDISDAKMLKLLPNGPTGGNGTANSKRYRAASGLGEGRVYASGAFAGVSNFKQSYRFGENDSQCQVYAYGYKVGEVDDGENLRRYPDRDRPINAAGNEKGAEESGYVYQPQTDSRGNPVDSFLYTWLSLSRSQENSTLVDSIMGGAFSPEYTEIVDAGTNAGLVDPHTPTGGNAGNMSAKLIYDDTLLEAVFSREYLASDNMGDINHDGIPDIYIDKYGLGVFDPVGGTIIGDDLKSITVENNGNLDEDYLPITGAGAYSSFIPGLPESWDAGTPFVAKTEIRGYGESLNDAPKQAGISGVKPERRYTDPRVDPASTLDGLDPNGSEEPVEYYAWLEFAAAHGIADPTNEANKAAWELWSPERPTDPTLKDTDDDGFEDGYEYFIWYRAHVGFMDGGVHRHLTGRAYDPRNPGEGTFISSAEIEKIFDPLLPYGDSSSAKLRDTDNDGLPDALEFEIGTNPFDFDTDGDGLPDGFEIMLGGTDPLLAETTKGVSDAMRNFDGDAMAFTTPYLEQNGFVQPKPLTTDALFTFALVDPKGDTDGIQWYVGKSAPTNVVATDAANPGTSFIAGGVTYVTSGTVPVVTNVTSGLLALTNLVLAVDLDKATTWTTTNAAPEGVETAATLFALMPTRIPAGTVVSDITPDVPYATFSLGEDVTGVNAAWVYGRSVSGLTTGDAKANVGGFGMLAIGRYQDAKAEDATGAKVRLAALPAQDDGVAYLHHFVYQEFGFDPRTAWNANTPLAPRWGKTVGSGETTETVANNTSANYGYAGVATRTREFTLYDEFLVLSFFLNNGKLSEADVTATQAVPWEKIWSKYTTNGQGPNEPNWEEDNDHYKGRTVETNSGTNGADTDMDGVPDGWELYIMAGPKQKGRYNLVAPYNDGIYSSFSPFVKLADSVSATDYAEPADRDDLSELQEYAGTDSCAYYCEPWGGNAEAFSTTIVRPKEHAEWLNKFFPTDPWNKDTDGDGLTDGNEAGKFKYGKPVDDGKMVAIPGGGLNPCTVDTDGDGLPDKWEDQFKGRTVYAGEDAQKPKDRDGNEVADGNVLQGLCDGMDGTVWDAYNSPRIRNAEEDYKVVYSVNGAGVNQVVDRDYDRDGLENWQEYMTGAMRAWRYDDPITGWSYIPDDLYWFVDPTTGEYVFSPDLVGLRELTGETISSEAEFWYKTLFDSSSALYNPHFVTGTSPSSQYFSRVTNGWDRTFTEQGTYYMFHDRVGDAMIKDSWGFKAAPKKYICTSPIVADTDKDGMDDGYELFHGLNPILGASGVLLSSDGPCDIVYDAWYDAGAKASPVSALDNPWMKALPGNGTYDFIVHPWLNGIVDVDPDGDDIRNQDEAIMPMVAPSTVWYHTDPTPLWMTDSSYGDSLVNRFFRMPIALGIVPVPESIVYKDVEYPLVDRDGFTWGKGLTEPPQYIAPFVPDFWLLSSAGAANWMYSFEENEGYDSDHDSGSDTEELQGKFRSKTDPQDADSPRRRQAMHFGGPENPSALQSMPFVHEAYPRAAMGYPDDMSFLQYTVECWVRPESAADATVLERTSFTDPSHVADERYVRRNFAIMIRNGKWCTAFDSNGTLDGSVVEVVGKTDVKVGEWTAVAATYDANRLTLYVNGNEDGYVMSSLKPEYGSSAVVVYPAGSGSAKTGIVDTSSGDLETLRGTAHAYWFDRQYTLNAFLIGASFANAADGNHLDVTQGKGWGRYRSFFKGWVDEVRVWDGARSSGDIATDVSSRKRYTREDALENRSSFYNQWVAGKLRYKKDGDGRDLDVLPELRFHWTFDSIPGADNAAAVAQAPHGFLEGDKPVYSRPEDYMIPWWSGIVAAYGSVYEGERNWVPWIPNTVTHLPRFDLTTLDSSYWSENYAGDEAGTYKFARTAEPVSKWTQMVRNQTEASLNFQTTGRRFWLSYNTGTNGSSTLDRQFEFTGRHLNQTGDDLLPLGGAFVKYVDSMWDDQGASSVWEQTGNDADNDGLADWWQEYAEQNYREGVPAGEDITWNTMIWYEVGGVKVRMTAGEAYRRDLAKGAYVDANGEVQVGPTAYAQTAKSDGMIPNWWKELKKIDGEEPLSDLDNDGLNNYVEYVASELLPFRLNLDPRMAKSDTVTLDYFRKIGKLYLGEMLTDHDQMEDHWERSLGDESIASAALWDALKDGEEDGWTNFAENRYNGYSQSILAQYISHAMGDNEVLDAPIPTIRMKVRYNGDRPLAASSAGGGKEGGEGDTEKSAAAPALVVRAFSRSAATGDYVMNPDAVWTVTPGVTVTKEVYLGGWEDRVVRGTMAPGNVDIGTLDIKFAQVPQNDLYSWTDESGTHLAGTYKEFKEALDKNPNIIQNIQNFEWLSLYAPVNEYTSADRAVTVTRNEKGQENARFAVYGEQVGTINLTTGDFEFDLGAMNRLRVNYTYDGGKGPAAAWSYKEAIFKITYTAKVPSTQLKAVDFSLAKADTGFVRGGDNSLEAFYDLNGNGAWDPGEPFGVVNGVDIGWAGRDVEIELTDMSAVTPRVKLWGAGGGEGGNAGGGNGGGDEKEGATASAADSDRSTRVGTDWTTELWVTEVIGRDRILTNAYTRLDRLAAAPSEKVNVKVVRYMTDNFMGYRVGAPSTVIMEKTFERESRDYLHEGDFLADGELDLDWSTLYGEVVSKSGVLLAGCEVTNVTYLITFNWGPTAFVSDSDTNTHVSAFSTLVTRRFERTRSVPTPVQQQSTVTVFNKSRPTFTWKIDGEDEWAAWFGTTYTAFKVRVKDLSGNLVYDSGVRRLPAKDSEGQYSWTAPLYVGEVVPGTGVLFANLSDYTWEVAVYNAKFKTDTLMAVETEGNPFSSPRTFRMNVTDKNASSCALAVRACYVGPATWLAGRIRVQAFESPDFTGDPVAAVTLGDVSAAALSPSSKTANAKLIGLPEGKYFLRAYIDTNGNGVHDDWESWGYLNERDLASKPGIFNPVAAEAALNPDESNVRTILIEDCDTDGDWFPDVWEAEQNGGAFDPEVVKPVTGDAELIGVNPELKSVLNASDYFPMLKTLGSTDGFALLTGIAPAKVKTTVAANGMSRFSVDNKVDSVTISKLEFDADGNVVISLDAKTSVGSVDSAAAAIYDLDLSKTVTCRIYRKTDLASAGWGDPVAEETVTVGAGPVTIEIAGEKTAQAYYRAEIVEK